MNIHVKDCETQIRRFRNFGHEIRTQIRRFFIDINFVVNVKV